MARVTITHRCQHTHTHSIFSAALNQMKSTLAKADCPRCVGRKSWIRWKNLTGR